jgi:hypothetical protein
LLVSQSKRILQDHLSDLLDLIGFPLSISGLQVEDLLHSLHRKDVVIAPDPFGKPESPEKRTQLVKGDIRIGTAQHNVFVELFMFTLGVEY